MCTMAMGTGRSYHDSYCNLGMKYQFSSFEFIDGTMLIHWFVCHLMRQNRGNLRGQNIPLKCSLMIRTFKRDFIEVLGSSKIGTVKIGGINT